MEKAHQLLTQSVAQYQAILSQIQKLPGILKQAKPRVVNDYCQVMRGLMEEAQRTDRRLADLLPEVQPASGLDPLLRQRQELMTEITDHNDSLFPKITGKIALIAAEISQVKDGLTALAGYRTHQDRTGKIINTSH